MGHTGLSEATVVFGDGPPTLRGITLLAAPGEVTEPVRSAMDRT